MFWLRNKKVKFCYALLTKVLYFSVGNNTCYKIEFKWNVNFNRYVNVIMVLDKRNA